MFDQLPIFGEGRTVYAKDRRATGFQMAKVLITVKAAPQPSSTYGDTVCVAGIRMDGDGPEWVRLYPIPFRSMEDLNKFKKYDVVQVPILSNAKDFRSESFKPERGKFKVVDHLTGWEARHPFIFPLANAWTMCDILRAQDAHAKDASVLYPSLAVIRPRTVFDLKIEPFEGWTRQQRLNIEQAFNQGDLLEPESRRIPLEEPRFRARFHYQCMSLDCRSHTQTMADWELEALSRRLQDLPEEEAIKAIQKRFVDERCNPTTDPLFFVGNLQSKPKAYQVLGIYRSSN